MISRRAFFAVSTGALLTSRFSWAAATVPTSLDHILLGCNDLQRGIEFVEKRTGVRAVFGGVHPGRGTQNALASLGKLQYLEIIAPDPKQNAIGQFSIIKELAEPRLIGWAAHPGDMDALAKKLGEAGVQFMGPRAGSRARPDGRMLKWKALAVADDKQAVIPFFIEWSADSPHPSADAPQGLKLDRFEAASPNPEELQRRFARLGLDVSVVKGDKEQLRAAITGPKGKLELAS